MATPYSHSQRFDLTSLNVGEIKQLVNIVADELDGRDEEAPLTAANPTGRGSSFVPVPMQVPTAAKAPEPEVPLKRVTLIHGSGYDLAVIRPNPRNGQRHEVILSGLDVPTIKDRANSVEGALTNVMVQAVAKMASGETVSPDEYPVDAVVNRLATYIRHRRENLQEPADDLIASLAADIDRELRRLLADG